MAASTLAMLSVIKRSPIEWAILSLALPAIWVGFRLVREPNPLERAPPNPLAGLETGH